MLKIDEEAALAAIPGLLRNRPTSGAQAFATLREVLGASGALDDAAAERLGGVATLFGLDAEPVTLVPRGRARSQGVLTGGQCARYAADPLEVRPPDRRGPRRHARP